MTEKKLKKNYIFAVYTIGIVSFIVILYIIEILFMETTFMSDHNYTYVSKTLFETNIPVVSSSKYIIKPYLDNKVTELVGFYDSNSDKSNQEKAIILYDGTYIQSTGIIYGGVESFDIISILDGKVTLIDRDDLLGNIIHIEYGPNIIGIYQGVKDITTKLNDTVKQGQIIAKSGTSNLKRESHLMFELIVNSNNVNPNDYYNKSIDEF